MEEIIKDIDDFPGYKISNYGYIISNRQGKINYKIKGQVTKKGYLTVKMFKNKISFNFRVHRLVLEAFVGKCPDGFQCCHNDGNPKNNKLSNLRWDTAANNQKDRVNHSTDNNGENNPMSKLSANDVLEIKRLSTLGLNSVQIFKQINKTHPRNIRRIINGERWKSI